LRRANSLQRQAGDSSFNQTLAAQLKETAGYANPIGRTVGLTTPRLYAGARSGRRRRNRRRRAQRAGWRPVAAGSSGRLRTGGAVALRGDEI
jgi:hypothetical protein